jgi:hypothetical protein
MPNLRSRIVNFRVTDEEFEQMKSAQARQGARCMSDFARTTVLASTTVDGEHVGNRLLELERRVASLEFMTSRLGGVPASPNSLAASGT